MQIRVLVVVAFVHMCQPALAEQPKSGIDRKGFDRSVRVQDDLFLFVNGEWLKHTPIPDDKSNYGSFIILMDDAQVKIREIIEEAADGSNSQGSDARKVGDFYQSYMNESLVEQRGLEPLRDELQQIDQLSSLGEVTKHFGYLQAVGVGTPIGFFVDQDDKNSSQYLAAVVQSGITLPDRDYYLDDDDKYQRAREALKSYVSRLFELGSLTDGPAAAEEILELETKLARVQWERTELRNAEKRYNKYAVDQLVELTPDIPWKTFFEAADASGLSEVNVMTPSFFEGLEKILEETPLEVWKRYLKFQLIDSYASVLSKDFVDAHFDLHEKELAGVPQQQPRWKRAVDATSGNRGFGVLGDAVGKLFVAKYFPPEAKQRMDELVKNLLKAYELSIDELTWMTDRNQDSGRRKNCPRSRPRSATPRSGGTTRSWKSTR